MSSGNIDYELQHTEFRDPKTTSGGAVSTVPVKIINVKDATYGKLCIMMAIASSPDTYAVASDGYTKDFSVGCLAIDLGGPSLWVNVGTVAAPNWTVQA